MPRGTNGESPHGILYHSQFIEAVSTRRFQAISKLSRIQGNCLGQDPIVSIPDTHAPLRPLLPGQCVLLVDTAVLLVVNSSAWLDNVYIRLTERRTPFEEDLLATRQDVHVRVEGSLAELWMTNTTLQGNGAGVQQCEACAIDAGDQAMIYAEGAAVLPQSLVNR